jgi:hypothetical protein
LYFVKYFLNVLLAVGLLGTPVLLIAGSPSQSGFFENDIAFEKHPDRRNAFRYIKKDLNLGDYNKVAIAPVEIWIHPESSYKGVQANNIKAISDQLRQILISTLEPDYPVVKQTGAKTIAVRLAVTGIKLKKKKKKSFISYMPIGMAIGAVQDEMLSKTTLSDAIIEAELVDGKTGVRIAALIDRNMAADLSGQSHSWDEIVKVFEYYAKRFKKSLDESR